VTDELHALQPTAEKRWKTSDPVLHKLSRRTRLESWPLAEDDGFTALVTSITHQQVSLAAGRTIYSNFVKAVGGTVTPRRVVARTPEQLRAAGLSRAKSAYILDLADKTMRGDIEFKRFPSMTDDAIMTELTAVKGIGDWTAKMFLMFHLRRPDVWAPEDLGLRIAVSQTYGVPEPKARTVMEKQRDAWAPFNSVAARVLWQSRRGTPLKKKA
jgi:DNA-3-methyladenine glycosylase II